MTKKQVDKKYPGDQTAQYVLCDDSTGLCVDANITTSGYGRFVNSFFGSGKGFNADFKFSVQYRTNSRGKRRKIVKATVIATKSINKGEEILVDYGADYKFHK